MGGLYPKNHDRPSSARHPPAVAEAHGSSSVDADLGDGNPPGQLWPEMFRWKIKRSNGISSRNLAKSSKKKLQMELFM
jgi:hypothetical protein